MIWMYKRFVGWDHLLSKKTSGQHVLQQQDALGADQISEENRVFLEVGCIVIDTGIGVVSIFADNLRQALAFFWANIPVAYIITIGAMALQIPLMFNQ